MRDLGTDFIEETKSINQVLTSKVDVSWNRNIDSSKTFAVVGTSQVGGTDIIQGEISAITKQELFEYTDETDYLLYAEYEENLYEPINSISIGLGSFILENTQDRFTPKFDATIGNYILPKRPIKLFGGYYVNGQEKNISLCYGISKNPSHLEDPQQLQVDFYDYLKIINDSQISETQMLQNKRTDEIIDILLQDVGFDSAQYELEQGLNEIGFVILKKGYNIGNLIQKLCEAEAGFFYQDENGILRFENRITFNSAPHNASVETLTDEHYHIATDISATNVINRAIVTARPREVVDNVEVWTLGTVTELNAGETITLWANFQDPVISLENLVAGDDFLLNTDKFGNGSDISSSVNITISKFVDTAKLVIENTSSNSGFITFLRLIGKPAVVVNEIEEVYEDTTSTDIYDTNEIIINNDFIDNPDFAKFLAKMIVERYSNPLRRIRLNTRAMPHLQMRDIVTVTYKGQTEDYRITGIYYEIGNGFFNQELTLREITDNEGLTIAVVGTHQVGGDEIII